MKKMFVWLFIMILLFNGAAYAVGPDGRTNHNGFVREGIVLWRGVINLVSSPLELLATPMREPHDHKWVWPITSIPHSVLNVIVRAGSSLQDILVYPFVVPFTNDISPLTEPYDLPEYIWQKR